MPEKENKAILRRAVKSFNNPKGRAAYFDLYDPQCVFHNTPPGAESNLEVAKQFYAGLWAAFPDGQLALEDVVAEGSRVTCRFVFRGTHRGDFMGIAPTRKKVALTGITILRFARGKCAERWTEADTMGLMQQLGAVSPPSTPSGQGNAQIVQQMYSDFGQGNISAILEALADDVEWNEPPAGAAPLAGTYRGREQVGGFFKKLVEAAEVEQFEPREFVAQGDKVLVLGYYRFRAKATGKIWETDWVMVWWFREGKVAKFQIYKDSAAEATALRGT